MGTRSYINRFASLGLGSDLVSRSQRTRSHYGGLRRRTA